jgi:preprotein translocase subunit SecA
MILSWAQRVKKGDDPSFLSSHLCRSVAIMDRAYQILSQDGHRLYLTQIMAIICFLDHNSAGHVAQVPTGEGKTTLIAILAVLIALQGVSVDVITTNEYLAEVAAQNQSDFFSLFGLTVSTNNHDVHYTSGPKRCYKANVVYGSLSNFQFDYLGDAVDQLNIRKGRSFETSWVILDEIDSLLIDQVDIDSLPLD